MILNKLYGLLVDGYAAPTTAEYEWYTKAFSSVFHTDKSKTLQRMIMAHVKADKAYMLAYFLCGQCIDSIFGEAILQLDPSNTYVNAGRYPSASSNDTSLAHTIMDMTCGPDEFKTLKVMLDTDIQDRLQAAQWLDFIAAACLQMLRETA